MKLEYTDNNFVTYKKFNTLFETKEIANILEKHNIDYFIENSSPSFDITMSANHCLDEFRIRIHPDNFELLNKLIISKLEELPEETHFIHNFSDNELIEVLKKPDEWSPEILFYAKNMLTKKEINISNEQLENWKIQRIEFLKKPENHPTKLIKIALVLNVFGGFSGMLVGWYLHKFVRTIFNGERVFAYNEYTRLKGKELFKSGLTIHILFVILLITYKVLKVF